MITQLNLTQESLMTSYRDKWKSISLSTKRINRELAVSALEAAYNLYPSCVTFPKVIFFESPYAAFKAELENPVSETLPTYPNSLLFSGEDQFRTELWFELDMDLSPQVSPKLWEKLENNLTDIAGSTIYEKVWDILWNWFIDKLKIQLQDKPDLYRTFYNNFVDRDSEWASYTGLFDFCINELKCQCEQEQWSTYQAVVRECGWWLLPTATLYVVCDRPVKLLLDEEERLHAEGEPAIQFSDGFSLYAERGQIISALFPSDIR